MAKTSRILLKHEKIAETIEKWKNKLRDGHF